MHSSSYQAFQKETYKEIWISKLGRGTHPGDANIFHELSAPDDQINLNEFTLKPLQMVSLSRSLRQFWETRITQMPYQPQDLSTRWFWPTKQALKNWFGSMNRIPAVAPHQVAEVPEMPQPSHQVGAY